jgi:hypothetical protein
MPHRKPRSSPPPPLRVGKPAQRGSRRETGSSCTALIRPLASIVWELRAAWAVGRRVALTIDGDRARDDETRAEGFVTTVAATGAYCKVSGLLVPLDRVLAVHHPSRLGDTDYLEGERWQGPIPLGAVRDPRQLELTGSDGRGL